MPHLLPAWLVCQGLFPVHGVSYFPTAMDTTVTFEGLAVFVLALLPGAVYTWAFERIAGRWGIGLTDRLYRFVGLSAIYQALIAPVTWKIWLKYLRRGAPSGDKLPIWLWPVAVAYLAIPAALGLLLAAGFRSGNRIAKVLVGATAPPTAWDAVFSGDKPAVVLLRLKSGKWLGGEYAEGSHVAGYPEPPDIYLAQELEVDQESGDLVVDDEDELVSVGQVGVLVRWEEVEYLEILGEAESSEELSDGNQS
jgi:hypothetical protein